MDSIYDKDLPFYAQIIPSLALIAIVTAILYYGGDHFIGYYRRKNKYDQPNLYYDDVVQAVIITACERERFNMDDLTNNFMRSVDRQLTQQQYMMVRNELFKVAHSWVQSEMLKITKTYNGSYFVSNELCANHVRSEIAQMGYFINSNDENVPFISQNASKSIYKYKNGDMYQRIIITLFWCAAYGKDLAIGGQEILRATPGLLLEDLLEFKNSLQDINYSLTIDKKGVNIDEIDTNQNRRRFPKDDFAFYIEKSIKISNLSGDSEDAVEREESDTESVPGLVETEVNPEDTSIKSSDEEHLD